MATVEQARIYRARWRDKNPDYHRRVHLKRFYNVTPEWFEAKWKQQQGKCSICHKDLERGTLTHIDHDHETEKLRDLLCQNCNHGIGSLQDDVSIVERALIYLRRHKEI